MQDLYKGNFNIPFQVVLSCTKFEELRGFYTTILTTDNLNANYIFKNQKTPCPKKTINYMIHLNHYLKTKHWTTTLFPFKYTSVKQDWLVWAHLYFTPGYRGSPPCTLSQHPDNRETGYSNVLCYVMLNKMMSRVDFLGFIGPPRGDSGRLIPVYGGKMGSWPLYLCLQLPYQIRYQEGSDI